MRHILFVLFVLSVSCTWAQRKETIIIRKYTQKEGINSYNIRRISEDEYGFMWIATQDGLSRFDGRNFTHYTTSANGRHRLCGVDIRELVPDTVNHLLWVLPGEVGVNVVSTLTGNVIRTIPIPALNSEDWNICMIKTGNFLWIGTFTGLKVFNIGLNRFEALPPLKGDSANSVEFEVRSILQDNSGNVWVAYSGYGVVIYDGITRKVLRTIKVSQLNDHLKSRSVRFLGAVEPAPGVVLFATNEGLRKIAYDRLYSLRIDNAPCKAWPRLNVEPLDCISRERNSVLVAGSIGFVRLDAALQSYTLLEEHGDATDARWTNAIQYIYKDSHENTWLGCLEGLAFVPGKKSPFEPYVYDEYSKIKLDHVRSIYPLDNGDILVGLHDGLVRIDHETRQFTRLGGKHVFNHIFRDRSGRLILSLQPEGLFVLDGDRPVPISTVYPEFAAFAGITLNSHIDWNDSLTVLGTENNNGILLWDPLHHRVRQISKSTRPDLLTSNIVNNIFRDAQDRLWVLSDNLITIFRSPWAGSVPLDLPYKLYFDMCEAGGYFWLGSYGGGIIQLDSGLRVVRVLNMRNGLANDDIYQLYCLGGKQLLVTSNNGISLLDMASLRFSNYFTDAGLHSNGFEEVCGVRKDNYIYAGGLNGFTRIDITRFSPNLLPPRTYFTGVHTQLKNDNLDTGNLRMGTLSIPNNWLQTNISLSALNYSRPEAVHYQYRILEQDSTWLPLVQSAGINLIGLAPGRYTIEAKAANEDGYWSRPVRLVLLFQPKWFETTWFKLALAALILGVLYSLYRYRIAQLKEQQRIRSGIASDLHDDIGSLLNSVKVFSHLARKEPESVNHFANIDESLLQATTGLRDMIWVLDNSEDTVTELIDRVRKYAYPVATACGVQVHYDIRLPEKQAKISKAEKRNLYLIAKEAINNSIKYAACEHIRIVCVKDKHGISLTVSDDGRGFDANAPRFGNGLKNIRERARQIHYRCTIHSVPGEGTVVGVKQL
jgi:signal transduction histidine kinase/ligand-binding sensor domain-containing protein